MQYNKMNNCMQLYKKLEVYTMQYDKIIIVYNYT